MLTHRTATMTHTPRSLSRFSRSLWLTLAAFVVFAMVFGAYVLAEKRIDRANELRLRSYLMANELRESSDDLTRMVRTYVVTGDPSYKQRYLKILEVRDGKRPRPAEYAEEYWTPATTMASGRSPIPGTAVPLLTLMQEAGFTEAEFQKLAQAKANSDALTITEFEAMHLLETANPVTDTVRHQASMKLHDEAYHRAKAGIMTPIDEFIRMMDARTLATVREAETLATLTRIVFVGFGLLLLFMLAFAYRTLRDVLGGTPEDVYKHIAAIGGGDFSSSVPVPKGAENSVLGWLSETQIKLASIDREHRAAESRNQRLTRLYAALSQCNQAIVRCSSEAELFPQICRDAVTFGGMCMAWIGLLDPETRQLKAVAAFGNGLEYLDGLHISIDPTVPSGRGPSGIAFRQNQPFWCQDFLHDPATTAWHARGAELGWGSSAALPLHRNGVVIGTFNLYADKPNAFDLAERNLLMEMATDIDFAIDRFVLEEERTLLENKLLESEQSSRLVLENALDAVINMDTQGLVTEWSGGAERLFGYRRDEAVGKVLAELIVPQRDRVAHHNGMLRLLASGQSQMLGKIIEVKAMHRDGHEIPVELSVAQIHRGGDTFFSAFIRDISDRKVAEERIQHLAHFDSLTGLPNRTQLNDHLRFALSLAKRSNGHLALMFLDLDHFKDINDNLGHSVGDALLVELANRLRTVLREEDTVSRLGGDEFIVLLPGSDARGAEHVAQKMLELIGEPYRLDPYELSVTGSIGIALYPEDGEDLETLSRNADTAMYRAKNDGRNGYRFFTSEMQARSARNLQLVNALRYALDRQQLRVHYQPQLSIQDTRVVGAEALLRWQHPELGHVSPAEFIPVAEDSGLILQIGAWVLREAVVQARRWLDDGHPPMVMAVNLSAVQFRHPDLPDLVSRTLDEVGLPPEYLELELTEGVAMHDPQGAIEVMNKLHDRGVRMSIDDFGTGYSSLSYLKKFKVYKLKIDQSFVRDISTDPEDKAIVSAIIHMARSLGLQTIAEGVETESQLGYLRDQQCDEAQGYLFSKPLAADQFDALLQQRGQPSENRGA